jgi:hypothetical protein
LAPDALWDTDRKLISTTEELIRAIQSINDSYSEQSLHSLYIFCGSESPVSSPSKEETLALKSGTVLPDGSSDSDSSVKISSGAGSVSSGKSSNQSKFRSLLLRRDNGKCRICKETESLEAAHIIDVKCGITSEVLIENYQLLGIYEVINGLILCANCHNKYDRHIIGIDPDGNVVAKGRASHWELTGVNIFSSPGEKDCRMFPSAAILNWHYKRFIDSVKPKLSLTDTFFSMFVSPSKNAI